VGKLVSLFFCLLVIVLGVVTVPVLCAITYFLASDNNNGNMWNGSARGDGKQEVKKKGKINKQTSRRKQNEESNKKVSEV
jgi:hypothetical protein